MATNRHDRQIDPPAPIGRLAQIDRRARTEAAKTLAVDPEHRLRDLGCTDETRFTLCCEFLGAAVGL